MTDNYIDSLLKLSDVAGRKVKDVRGHISMEFGDPTFQISCIEYEDGACDFCGGEHDLPYVEVAVPEQFIPPEEEA